MLTKRQKCSSLNNIIVANVWNQYMCNIMHIVYSAMYYKMGVCEHVYRHAIEIHSSINPGHSRWAFNCAHCWSHTLTFTWCTVRESHLFTARTMYATYFLTYTSESMINIQCNFFLHVPPSLYPSTHSPLPVLDDCTSWLPAGGRRRKNQQMCGESLLHPTLFPTQFIWFLILSHFLTASLLFPEMSPSMFNFHTPPCSASFLFFVQIFIPLCTSLPLPFLSPVNHSSLVSSCWA